MKTNQTKIKSGRRSLRLFSLSVLLGIGLLISGSTMAQVLYSVSNLTGVGYTPISGGTVINSTAQLTAGAQSTNQDDGSALVTLPFTFSYCGANFTQVTFCTNGWIGFGDQSTVTALNSRTAGNLWITTEPSNTLGAWFKDMGANFGVGFPGEMVHGLVGTDIYAFEWKNAVGSSFSNTTANLINFQIVLYGPGSSNPGRIEYLYGSTLGTTAFAAAIGMEDAVGGSGRFLNALNGSTTVTSTSTVWPGNGNGFRFTPFSPCVAPIDQATALTFGTITTGAIAGSYTAAVSAPSGYLVVAYPTGSAVTNPVDATSYLPNQTLGLGKVVSVGTSLSFNATGLLPNQGYDFYVYTYNSTLCSFGPKYNTSSPLTGTATTNACGGPVAGTYSIPTNYATLSAALADINTNGMQGSVILELESSYTSGAETFPLVISHNSCINALSTLTIRPKAGATALTIQGSNAGPTIDLNGADYVTIDGRPGGLGTTSQLSVINTTTTGVAMRLYNDASNNTITYVDLQGSNVSGAPSLATLGGVVYMGGADGVFLLGNDNNTISNCKIHGYLATTPAFGIASIGTSTGLASAYNDNNTVTNCNIYDYFLATGASGGIKLDAGCTGWTITNNSLYQTATRTITTAAATHRGMWITPNTGTLIDRANNFNISNNFIGGSAPSNGGAAYNITSATSAVMYGMDLSVGSGTATSVQNNTISNIAFTSTSTASPSFAAISTVNGNVNIGTVTGNTIGSGTGTGSIVLNMTGSLGTSFGIRLNGGTSTVLNASNNTIGSITINNAAATVHNFSGISCTGGTTTNVTINNNLVGSTSTANSIQMPVATTSVSAQALNGIFISSGPSVSAVTNNTVANLYNNYNSTSTTAFTRGIAVTTSATTVTGNTVRNLTYGGLGTGAGISSGVTGIGVSATTGVNTVSSNTVHTLKLTNASATTQKIEITGMYIGGGTFANVVAKNTIHSLSLVANDTAAVITGIDNGAGTVTFVNNMVRLGIDENGVPVTTGCMIRGITKGNSSSCNFWHNSVYIGGSGVTNSVATSIRHSFAFVRGTSGTADDIRNNIFSNQRSNGSATGATHYAIRLSSGTGGLTLNNNVYYVTGTGGVFGYNGTANVNSYAAGWAAGDLLSYETNPQFLAPNGSAFIGDLHINPSVGTLVEQTGATIAAVTDDYDGQLRSGLTPNDIGADAGNFISLGCTGTPSGGTISASASSICAGNGVTLSLTGFTNLPGITFQWQQSSTTGGPYVNVTGGTGATTGSYVTPALSNSTYYICVVTCNGSGLSANSAEALINVNNPQILTTTPGSICGTGSASLSATATAGATINWYTAPTGGAPIATGSTYNTPIISTTTNYYASASVGGTNLTGGKPGTNGVDGTNTLGGIYFTANQAFTLNSVKMYPTAAGTNTIVLYAGSVTSGTPIFTTNYTFTGANSSGVTVPLNWNITPGTYTIYQSVSGAACWRDFSGGSSVPATSYPYNIGTACTLTDATLAGYYYFFYNWSISTGCESARTTVTATVTSPPPTTITAARTIACNDEVVAISETSGNYSTTTWTPTGVLYTNSGGTSPYTGGNNPNVFLRSTTPGSVNVILTATQGTCTEVDTVTVFVQPAAATTSSTPSDLCVSGSVVVNLTPSTPYAPNTIQWQSSLTGSGYANIGGATANSYTTPVLTNSTYYQAEIRNSNNDLCFTSTPYQVVVNNPQLLGTTPGSRCGAGTVNLAATASPGATINWYASPTGGAPIGTGTSFTTPVIAATTNFYAAASNGGSTLQGGKPSTNGADGTNTIGGIYFTANQTFTLNSVVMYPTGAGTNTIVLYPGSVTTGTPIYTMTYTFTGAAPTGVTVPINWSITPGTYTLYQSVSGTACWRDFLGGTSLPATAYPYNIGAACTLTDGTLAGYLYFFYNWTITTGCEGSRTAVTATINTSPTITAVSGASSICNGNSTTVSVSSSNDPNYTYSWTSTPAGFTASGAGPHTVTPTAASTVYTVQAIDNTAGPFAGCGALSTVTITTTTNSITATASSTPATVCEGEDAQLNVNASTGGIQYTMSSLTGQTYTPLTGAGITTINTTAQLLSGMGSTSQDDGGVVVTLPFTFNYNGSPFTQMSFCTNGWVGAGNQGTIDALNMRVAANLFTSTIPNNTIAAWFKDMGANFPTGTGSMRHGLIGTDVYAFQWDNAVGSGFSDGSTVLISFQINIHGPASATPGVIDLIYGPTVGSIATAASIGIENAIGGTNNYINALTGNGTATTTSSAWPGNGNGYRFTPLPPGGLTYDWSANSNFLTATNIANPVAQNVTSTQNYSVLVTQTSTGCTKTANVTLNISPLPEPLIGSNAPVCQGQDINLFGSNTATGQTSGNTFSWTGPAGFVSGSQNPTVSGVTVANTGWYYLTVQNSFGCTKVDSIDVQLFDSPDLNIFSQTNVACNGEFTGAYTIEVTNPIPGGNYLFNDGVNVNFDGIFTGVGAGTYSVEVTDDNSCSSTIPVTITEADPTTTADAGTDQVSCFGNTVTLAGNTALVGTGSWSVIAGSGTVTNPASPTSTVTGLSAGLNTFRWTIDNTLCGNSNFDDVDVTVNDLPTASLSGTTSICTGNSTTITAVFTGAGPWTYSYSNGVTTFGPFTTSNNPELITVAPTTTRTYTITAVADANCPNGTTSGNAVITVDQAPPANSVTITTLASTGCVGNTVTVATNAVIFATQYTWSAPAGTLINGQPSPVTTTVPTATLTLGPIPANSSGWEICAQASNACGVTNTQCKYIRGSLSLPASITGSTVACASSSGTYSTLAVPSANGYTWTGTNGITFTGSGTSVTANFPAGFTSGQICVAATLACGYTGPARCITVTNAVSSLGLMNGPFAVCPGQTGLVFSVPAANGVATYNWTPPANVSITSGQGTNSITVSVAPGFTVGNLCVTATSTCGVVSAARCKTISSTLPGTPGNISGATNGICGQTITYSVPVVAGITSYNWILPSGATLASANGNSTVDVTFSGSFTTGQLCVTANNSCGTSTARCVNVKGAPSTPGIISGPVTVCTGEQGTQYSVGAVFGATGYNWVVPAGATIIAGQNTTTILVDWGTTGGLVTVAATNGCGTSGTRTLNVIINCKESSSVLPGVLVNAYPNPVSSELTLTLETVTSGAYTAELLDVSGRVVLTEMISAVSGENTTKLNVSELAKGMYMLSIKNAEGFAKQIRIAVE